MDLAIFLPCRAGSQRVEHKNVRSFAGISGGLLQIKIEQIIQMQEPRVIMVSTNDPQVVEVVRRFDDPRMVIDARPDELASSSTSTDDLIRYVPTVLEAEYILWTHVTSPFVGAEVYSDALKAYVQARAQGHDSLMSVTPVHKFIWNKKGPLYDVSCERWPRTQTIQNLFEVNSAIFLASRHAYITRQDRIGNNPFLYSMTDELSMDIDWEEDFIRAEQAFLKKQRQDESVESSKVSHSADSGAGV